MHNIADIYNTYISDKRKVYWTEALKIMSLVPVYVRSCASIYVGEYTLCDLCIIFYCRFSTGKKTIYDQLSICPV